MSALKQQLLQAAGLQQRGHLAQAADAYRALLARAPSLPVAMLMLGRIERQLGHFEPAAQWLAQVDRLKPDSPEVLAELGYLALATNDNAGARNAFGRLTALKPELADAWFNLGMAHKGLGEPAAAIAAFERAIASGVASPEDVYTELALVQTLDRQLDAARENFEAALSRQPELPRALHGLAVVLISDGDFERARGLLRRAIAGDPNLVESYQHLADSRRFESLDDPDVKLMQALYEAPERSDYAREKLGFALGKIYNDCGDYDRAFATYARANALKKARVPSFDRARHRGYSQRLAQVFDARRLARPEAPAAAGVRPLFIVGMPRSGTTLVEQILCSHSRVAGAGERTFLEQEVVGRLAAYPGSFENGAVPDAFDDVRREYLQHLADFAEDEQYVTDKFPGNFQHLGMISLMFPEAKIVHCARDPLDNCLSIFFQDFGKGNYYAYDLDDIASVHNDYRQLMAHWAEVLPMEMFDLQYEELVAAQELWTRRLLHYCELEFEPACLEFDKNQRVVDTLSRWQVRQPMYKASLGRWQRYQKHLDGLRAALGI